MGVDLGNIILVLWNLTLFLFFYSIEINIKRSACNRKSKKIPEILIKKSLCKFNFSIFRQKPLHVPGVSTAHHEEVNLVEVL